MMRRRFVSRIADRFFPRHTPASEHPDKLFKYPELEPRDVENARLFARRHSLVEYLAPELRGGTVAEVGVMYGDFSEFIIRTIEPELFVAIDTFRMHLVPAIWEKPSVERFQGMTHREFYETRFSDRNEQVRCEEGDSCEVLSRYPDRTFDMIYVDAGHDYESVKRDANLSKHKLKPEGILIFNDYIRYSHYDDSYYGVIPVVNDLVVNQEFKVVGFALQADMYCDIAIRRRGDISARASGRVPLM
jgi:Methyltransferase domain